MLTYLRQNPEAFDPETVQILSRAFDEAWKVIQESGAWFTDQEAIARDTLAQHIVDLAKHGERDQQKLTEDALLRFKL